ncbi:MAG: glycosyltransferase [Bacillota bacterium]
MKKRVLHLLTSNVYSGAENIATSIIDSMSDNYEMAYASPNGPIQEALAEKRISYIPIKSFNPIYLNSIFRQWKPDIIHAHDFRASIGSAFSLYPCDVISHIHQNPLWIRSLNVNTLLYSLSCFLYKKIVLVSPIIAEEALFSKFSKKKIRTIYNVVSKKKVVRLSREDNFKEVYDIAFIGRMAAPKNPLRFIEIMKEIIDIDSTVKAVMVGSGALYQSCEELINSHGLKDNIKMVGHLSNPFTIMNNSKLIVMTSSWEGFGLVAVESMILGKPVFSSPVGGLKLIVNENCGGLCESNEEFIVKMLHALNDQNHYISLSESAKINAMKFCDEEKWELELYELYQK